MENLDRLLPAIVARDADAFAAWMAAAEPRLRASLRRFAAQVDTEAVLQEALLRAWTFADRVEVDGRGDSLLRYALRVAHNLAIDHVRRVDRSPVRALEDGDEGVAEPVAAPDPALRRRLNACVEQLPASPRAAFLARVGHDGAGPDRELATRVGMGLNTFLKNVGRARQALRDCLELAGVRWEAT
jgi:RNA polymerase sigma factor (sigma-70 family)